MALVVERIAGCVRETSVASTEVVGRMVLSGPEVEADETLCVPVGVLSV